VDLSWQDTSQIESEFRIERSTDGGPFSPAGQASQNATTFSDLTVQARHAYRYRVFAVNNAGDSDPSNELEVDIPAAPPTSPDGLQVTEDTPGVVQVTWNDKSSDEDGFDLERTQLGGQAAHFYLGAGATSYQDSAVSLNRTYSYRVRAFIDATNSDYSGQVAHLTRPAPPGSLAALAVSNSRINLTWANPNGSGVGSSIERSGDGGMTWTEVFTGPASTLSTGDTGLLTDHEYRYRARYVNGSGYSAYSGTAVETTFPNPPDAPTNLSVQAVSSSELRVMWTDGSSNETSFRIQRRNGGVWGQIAQVGAGVSEFVDSGLAANAPQTYRVLAANRGGASTPSNEGSGLTLPLKPTNLAVSAQAQLRLDLSWTDPNAIKAATKVERSEDGGQSFTPVTTVSAGTASYQDAGLEPAKSYTYRLKATNASGDSAPTTGVSGSTWPLPPAAPTDLQITSRTQTLLRLEWADPQSNEAGIRVERNNGGQWQTLATLGPNATSFEVGALQPDSPYTFRVLSFNVGGDCSTPPQVSGETLPVPPGAPGGVTATATDDSHVTVSWASSPTATSYRIERKVGDAPEFSPVATPDIAETQWSDSGLPELTVCTYRVYAVNEGGDSPAAEAGATTLPKAPANVAAEVRVHDVMVTWADVSQAESGYRVEAKKGAGGFQNLAQLPANSTAFLHIGVEAGATYTYRVTALGPGASPVSAPAFSSAVTAPPMVSGPKLVISPKSLDFGTLRSGSNKAKVVTLKNTGTVAMTLYVNSPAAPFVVTAGQGSFVLGPRASRRVTVELRADLSGAKTGALPIASTASAKPNATVPLKGKVR
jgi:titin